MKSAAYFAFAVIVSLLVDVPSGWGQSGNHRMISPDDLKWGDIPSLPPGAKIAVIEGPPNEAVPFGTEGMEVVPRAASRSWSDGSNSEIIDNVRQVLRFTRLRVNDNARGELAWQIIVASAH